MMKNDEERQEQAVEVQPQTDPQSQASESHISLAYAGIIISSIVLLVSLTANAYSVETGPRYRYGISLASIAMIFSTLGWFLSNFTSNNDLIIRYINVFLFVWCLVGACFMTFGSSAPFEVTGNGYFGSWGLAIFSIMALGVNMESLRENVAHNGLKNGASLGAFASSLVLLVAISTNGIDKNSDDYGELVFALMVALLTIVIRGAVLLLHANNSGDESTQEQQPNSASVVFLLVLSILWITAACLVTFRGPFVNTGNGYFGAWGGAATSVFAVHAARRGQ
jgi:hypothetical protein